MPNTRCLTQVHAWKGDGPGIGKPLPLNAPIDVCCPDCGQHVAYSKGLITSSSTHDMSNGNDDDFENTTKKYFLVVKNLFVFNCNWNWKCLGEKSPKHLFFDKKWNFFWSHSTRLEVLQKRGVWSKSNGRPLAWSVRRATGRPLAARACPWKDLFSLQRRAWSVRRATGRPLAARACPWKDLFSLQRRVLADDPK